MGVRLGTLSTGAPDWTPYSKEDIERLKQVDCVWVDNGRIAFAVEVEYTTQFTEAMMRTQSLDEAARRIFVVPKHRLPYIQKRLSNQLFSELIKRQGWRFLTFEELSRLAQVAHEGRLTVDAIWAKAALQLELEFSAETAAKHPRKLKKAVPEPELFKD
jgi:hypothetical protein